MFPIALDLDGRRVVVIGGGSVAERKVRSLLEAGARVTAIAPSFTPSLAALDDACLERHERPYRRGDLAGAVLAFAAVNDAVNAAVVAEARESGILINDAADAERGDFVTPAVHRAGPIAIAIETGGLSPSFAKRIRSDVAATIDARYGRAATALGRMREYVTTVVPSELRAPVMQRLAEQPIAMLAGLDPAQAQHLAEETYEHVRGHEHTTPRTLVCASRASALAMTQTRAMMARLAQGGIASTVLNISTRGDEVQDRSLAAIGTDSLFVKELENALRDGRADYAVHSCKDLPSTLPEDMTIAAITAREDARDAYCSERFPTIDDLPTGARVGTSSPRRRVQLLALRPDLVVDDIRGNVDTRLRKIRDGEYDATFLAMAGLNRLGLRARYTVALDPAIMTPAVAQGALAIETRVDHPLVAQFDALLGDPETTLRVTAERAFLRAMRGGCQAPIGAHATIEGDALVLRAAVGSLEGSEVVRGERRVTAAATLEEAEVLGAALAAELALVRDGALHGRLFLLPRTQDRPSRIAPALRDAGADVVEVTDSDAARMHLGGRVPDVILFPSSGSVMAITDYLRTLRDDGHRPVVAAMGPASSERAVAEGFPPDVVAPSAEVGAFVASVARYVLGNHVS